MKSFNTKLSVKLSLLIVVAIFIIISCNDSTEPDPDPPTIPPQSALTMDLTSLTSPDASMLNLVKVFENTNVMAGTNWTYAAGTVAFWTTVTNIVLAIPVAGFVATINEDPEYLGKLRWKWTKNFGVYYTAELYGEINGSTVEWEMYISQTGGFQDFLWYTGESNLDGSGGTWVLKESADNPVDYLQVEWNYYSTGVGDLRYEVVKSGASNEGSYIFYEFDNSDVYNSACTLYDSENVNTVYVEWHRVNRNGRVKSPNYFGDDQWYCWDESRNNIDCN